jgi:hypothetical protein
VEQKKDDPCSIQKSSFRTTEQETTETEAKTNINI